MLLGAGYSLGAALEPAGRRGLGRCAPGPGRRLRPHPPGPLRGRRAARVGGASPTSTRSSRLVAVLALNREAGDLGRLVADEARSIRREVQRELIEQIERRAQQVWIPVTVATLVPGAVLLAVPFIEALRLFSTT